ncbi:MAG TPA: sigma-70 family RNA polymerase sigma factor [Woeseiaceae bacterium]|nr:sigma-70 family RNA polymerase sigma factor [Woeseiaceae bacterium]
MPGLPEQVFFVPHQPFRRFAVFMDKEREVALVRDCQQGDRRGMDTLVRQFEKTVFNAAYRMLGNADEASDVTQTVFLKVFENIRRFDPDFRLFSWVYRIAVNEAINQLNRRKRFAPNADLPCESEVPEDTVSTSQLCSEVQAVLMELQPDHRAVIVLRYFTECSYEEIGKVLELPEKTVKSRLFTARQQMKGRLLQHGILSA